MSVLVACRRATTALAGETVALHQSTPHVVKGIDVVTGGGLRDTACNPVDRFSERQIAATRHRTDQCVAQDQPWV